MKEFQDGDPLFGAMMHAIANLWPNGTAVLSGCAPTGSGSARQVTVAGGTVVINGTVVSISQQTKTLDAATFDRYDLVSVNASGQAVVTKGVDTRRVPPVPANSVPIAICLVETGTTTLPADRIYDARMDALRVSALTIDADKDWAGKDITNVGVITGQGIEATQKKSYAYSDNVIHMVSGQACSTGSTTPMLVHTATVPQGYMTSKFRLKIDHMCPGHEGSIRGGYVRITMNDRSIGEKGFFNSESDGWQTFTVEVDGVEPGTVFKTYVWSNTYGWTAPNCIKDFRICGDEETYVRRFGSPDITW